MQKDENKIKEKKFVKNRGITLIALVITIIVLLILAGVSISMLSGDNGILSRAAEARIESRASKVEEEKNLWKSELGIDKYAGTNEAKTLDELLNELLSQELITDSEKQIILDTGIVTIGSRTIEFMTDEEKPTIVNVTKNTALPAGTEENPYQIFSIEDLVQLSINVNSGDSYEGKYIKMMKTLDFNDENSYLNAYSTEYGNLNGIDDDGNELKTEMMTGTGFTPLAQENNTYFSGNFEGNNYRIENIYINGKNYASFISKVKNAKLSNLEITGSIVAIGPAGIIGLVEKDSTFRVENCINRATLNSTGPGWIGGIINTINSNAQVEMINCNNNVNLGTYNKNVVGGLVYSNLGTLKIDGGGNTGELQGYMVGGIVCRSNTELEVSNCNNTGNITSNGSPTGGIIGVSGADSVTFKNCKNSGNITSTSQYVGGIIGNSKQVNLEECKNSGIIKSTAELDTGNDKQSVGGLVGYASTRRHNY